MHLGAVSSMRSGIRAALVIGLGFALLAGTAVIVRNAAAAPAHAVVTSDGSQTITVTVADQFAFTPNTIEVNPGGSLVFDVEQLGSTPHTFTLSPVSNYTFSPSNTTQDLMKFFTAHPPLVNLSIPAGAGQTYTATINSPPPGIYEYVCLESGHFQAGMFGLLGIGFSVGPPPGPPVPWGVYYIAGGVATLVTISVVLGFVMGKREGSKHEMPPERLGYPEPPEGATGPASPKTPGTGH